MPLSRRNAGRAQRSLLLKPAPPPPVHAFDCLALFAIPAAHAILRFPFTLCCTAVRPDWSISPVAPVIGAGFTALWFSGPGLVAAMLGPPGWSPSIGTRFIRNTAARRRFGR
jgi:hypothetical protein